MNLDQKEAMNGEIAEELQTVADKLAGHFKIDECLVQWRWMSGDEEDNCGFYMTDPSRIFINCEYSDGSISPNGSAVDCLLHEFAHHLQYQRSGVESHDLNFLAGLEEIVCFHYKDLAKYGWRHEYAYVDEDLSESDLDAYANRISWLRSLHTEVRSTI